jgi:predicted unusual protein kinase regulating ubiquinone biosynthesis (AarF/ABC1/UbiB family)
MLPVVLLLLGLARPSVPPLPRARPPAPPAFALESTMVSPTLSFEEKMRVLEDYYASQPARVALRLGAVAARLGGAATAWSLGAPDRADTLRAAVSDLGVVFVKVAQTLATRPDVIGDEAAAALATLQDGNAPFDDGLALRIMADDLGVDLDRIATRRVPLAALDALLARPPVAGPHAAAAAADADGAPPAVFAWLTAEPIAAASLAQVYRAETPSGERLAVKVRRPAVAENIALDTVVLRSLLRAAQAAGALSAEADIVEMTTEVGAGLFRELDFEQEARNARRFAAEHAACLPDVVVPRSVDSLTRRRVLCSEWVDGAKLGELGAEEQARMIRLGLDACFTQLLRTGFIHADPHYGNMVRAGRTGRDGAGGHMAQQTGAD